MESLEKIRKYINNVKIRKTVIGGYDREDVYMKMNELVEVFKEYVKEELENQNVQKEQIEKELQKQRAEIETYKKKLQESQSLVVDLNMKLNDLTAEQANTLGEMEDLKNTYKKYCSNILEQYSGSLRTLSTEFSKILENISILQQNIVELDSLENIEFSAIEQEEKMTVEIPELGIDIDEWLRGAESSLAEAKEEAKENTEDIKEDIEE